MDLVYVDKITKDIKDVKYLLLRRDLFDRTVDAKGMNTKNSKETIGAFSTRIAKKNAKKIGSTWEQNMLESFKNFAKLKEYKFTRQ